MAKHIQSTQTASLPLLGIECGGTHTVSLLSTVDNVLLQRLETGAANLRLLADEALRTHFQQIGTALGVPAAVGVGIAGARGADDCRRVLRILAQVWPGVPARVGHDLESALAAAGFDSRNEAHTHARIIVLAGTGSCTYGKNRRGLVAKVGGWGHLLGDHGSGYDIGYTALRTLISQYDQCGTWPVVGQRLLRRLQLSDPEELIAWIQGASKQEVAALATEVFAARRCHTAREVLEKTAAAIALDAAMCARQLGCTAKPVEFVFTGGVFTRQAAHVRRVQTSLQEARPRIPDVCRVLERESAWGAVALAAEALAGGNPVAERQPVEKGPRLHRAKRTSKGSLAVALPVPTGTSPTEARNPRSMKLDQLSTEAAVDLMIREEASVAAALRAESKTLVKLIRRVARAFAAGGRLFYVGAGTSGRLGVLDASECPPTFRSDPAQVQGIMAGGVVALHSAVEGAEDNFEGGARAVAFREVTRRDVVLGIAASGRTPFVWGALAEAKKRRAFTAVLNCNPNLRYPATMRPGLVLSLAVGPEILTGSTRLKSGTVTKLALNMITTLAMIQQGKVISNLMVDLNPSNTKLRQRAVRIVDTLTQVGEERAQAALEQSRWIVKEAVRALRRKTLPRNGRP